MSRSAIVLSSECTCVEGEGGERKKEKGRKEERRAERERRGEKERREWPVNTLRLTAVVF